MYVLNLLKGCLPACLLAASPAYAGPEYVVDHYDLIEIDSALTLPQLIESTLAQYPDTRWIKALEEEAQAIQQRSESWLADTPSAELAYQEASSGTLHFFDVKLHAPLWNFGQRDAENQMARQAYNSAQSQSGAMKLRVAGLIRNALWDIALQNIRYEQAQAEVAIAEQLAGKVKKLFELGELPRADLLLAQSELLRKRSMLTLAEAEVMHARKFFLSMTQSNRIPANYLETLFEMSEIQQNHPLLAAINSQIVRKKAEIDAIRLTGSGQSEVSVGVNSDRGDSRSNDTESFNIAVTIPFGGSAHLAPKIAAANVELNRLVAEREQLYRDLERAHHEAEHNLQVNEVQLGIGNELKQIAEKHLKMAELSFLAGEINLMDLLKIQSRTQQSALNAKERSILLQRDIALYNQAVGVLP